ncbi:putative lysine-specific demethylase JMJD5 [Colletotrichum tanaceti]|uniref:Putative lysine-specific demethylase JMJD5 n=1 Tax=Colletotrichum tanaceti TaxID=1306861 RepID=A0A4V6DHT0_9PEZI|nr:putative lysine-specific demethylase JMJD5 [Colletotrichum tanaceti]TKW57756.1 putative lysine-specific demethylase JMJD5 [Colletotrichum tanaceti]
MRRRVPFWCRTIRSPKVPSTRRNLSTVKSVEFTEAPYNAVDVAEFRQSSFKSGSPLLFKQPATQSNKTPRPSLSSKWFSLDGTLRSQSLNQRPSVTFTPYLEQFAHHMLPYELMSPQLSENTSLVVDTTNQFLTWLAAGPDPMGAVLAGIVHAASHPDASESRFSSFVAPLMLLLKAAEFNKLHEKKIKQLYIAQAQLADLPPQLRDDLPVPRIVMEAGKGDIYGSSLWLGLEPTYTPLHRDPNPNLFCQLVGNKVIRLLPPSSGDSLYRRVQTQIQQAGNSRIRTIEMMEGRERVVMNTAVWGMEGPEGIVEARLSPGDALFIPTGWWHSVKSGNHDGRLNASVNWWFR